MLDSSSEYLFSLNISAGQAASIFGLCAALSNQNTESASRLALDILMQFTRMGPTLKSDKSSAQSFWILLTKLALNSSENSGSDKAKDDHLAEEAAQTPALIRCFFIAGGCRVGLPQAQALFHWLLSLIEYALE